MATSSLWGTMLGLQRKLRESGLTINAAAVAYNAFLALVPLAFAVLGIAGAIGQSESAVERVRTTLEPIVPETVNAFITDLLVDAGQRIGGGGIWLVVVSIAVALVFGSRAVVALQKAMAAVEERTERRPPFEMRLVAIGLTIGGGTALVITSFLLVSGRRVLEFFVELWGADVLLDLWVWLRVPVAAAGLYVFLIAFYRLGPPEPLPRAWLAALVATIGSVAGSLGFGMYLAVSPELGATFGVLGAVAVALVWLYVGAMAILLGGVVVAHLSRDETPQAPDTGADTVVAS